MSEQATTQQDTREQQVEALARVLHKPSPADATQIGASWRRSESLRNAAALLDGPVARMIADAEQAAERRGAERARANGHREVWGLRYPEAIRCAGRDGGLRCHLIVGHAGSHHG